MSTPKLPKARGVRVDYSRLTDDQVESWYARIRSIKPNAESYRHKPLEEAPIIWQPLERVKETA